MPIIACAMPRFAQELALGIEDRLVVVIEAEDHPAPHLEPRLLHRVYALDERSAPLTF